MEFGSFREPTENELSALEAAYNEYYAYGGEWSLDEYPIVIIDNYDQGENEYTGRLGIVVDGGANSTTYGFDESGAFIISDALNEKEIGNV